MTTPSGPSSFSPAKWQTPHWKAWRATRPRARASATSRTRARSAPARIAASLTPAAVTAALGHPLASAAGRWSRLRASPPAGRWTPSPRRVPRRLLLLRRLPNPKPSKRRDAFFPPLPRPSEALARQTQVTDGPLGALLRHEALGTVP